MWPLLVSNASGLIPSPTDPVRGDASSHFKTMPDPVAGILRNNPDYLGRARRGPSFLLPNVPVDNRKKGARQKCDALIQVNASNQGGIGAFVRNPRVNMQRKTEKCEARTEHTANTAIGCPSSKLVQFTHCERGELQLVRIPNVPLWIHTVLTFFWRRLFSRITCLRRVQIFNTSGEPHRFFIYRSSKFMVRKASQQIGY